MITYKQKRAMVKETSKWLKVAKRGSQMSTNCYLRKINMIIYALTWSIIIGMVTAAYLNLVNWVIDLVWHEYLRSSRGLNCWYPFIICIPAGFLIGFLSQHLGDYPLTIEEVLTQIRLHGRLNYHHWWKSFALGLLVLAAGGSIGPEASTTVLTGSMINWLGDRLRWARFCLSSGQAKRIWLRKMDQQQLKKAPTFSQLFESKRQRLISVGLLVIIGISGAALVFKLFPEEGVFGIHHHLISWQWTNLWTAIPAILVGLVFGKVFIWLANWSALMIDVKLNRIWQGGIFGLIIAASSWLSGDILFSGEFRIVPFTHEALKLTVPFLIMVAVIKAIITNLSFAMGWRGGTIFPAIFSSLAIGVACALLLPGDVRINAVIVLTTSLTVILGKPLLASLLIILLVPVELTPVILVAALLTNQLVSKLPTRRH